MGGGGGRPNFIGELTHCHPSPGRKSRKSEGGKNRSEEQRGTVALIIIFLMLIFLVKGGRPAVEVVTFLVGICDKL